MISPDHGATHFPIAKYWSVQSCYKSEKLIGISEYMEVFCTLSGAASNMGWNQLWAQLCPQLALVWQRKWKLLKARRMTKERSPWTSQFFCILSLLIFFFHLSYLVLKFTFSAKGHNCDLCVYAFLPTLNGVAVSDIPLARLKPPVTVVKDVSRDLVCVYYGK